MQSKIESILAAITAPKDERIVRVEITSSQLIEGRHIEAGRIIDINESTLRGLDPGTFTRVGGKKDVQVADPTPARREALPPPDGWQKLPPSFAKWWELNQRFEIAKDWLQACRDNVQKVLGFNCDFGSYEGPLIVNTFALADNREPFGGIVNSSPGIIDTGDPVIRKLNKFVFDAIRRAQEHLKDVRQQYGTQLRKLSLECGLHRIDLQDEVQGLVQTLNAQALEIFRVRVAPLGLAEFNERRLFAGSATFQKYVRTEPNLSGQIIGGFGPDGQPMIVTDLETPTEAAYYVMLADQRDELTALLAEAKAELSKARKAAAS